jgi:hypothetical protein
MDEHGTSPHVSQSSFPAFARELGDAAPRQDRGFALGEQRQGWRVHWVSASSWFSSSPI